MQSVHQPMLVYNAIWLSFNTEVT